VRAADMLIVTAPGALELPLTLQRHGAERRFDALVALGCVIRGETYHFEIVSNEIGARHHRRAAQDRRADRQRRAHHRRRRPGAGAHAQKGMEACARQPSKWPACWRG
jgi:hypothetical protein